MQNTKLHDHKPKIIDLQRNVNSVTMWWRTDKPVNYTLLEKHHWPDPGHDSVTEGMEARIFKYPTYEDRHVAPPKAGVNYSYRIKFFYVDDTESDWSDSYCVMSEDEPINEVRRKENAREQRSSRDSAGPDSRSATRDHSGPGDSQADGERGNSPSN